MELTHRGRAILRAVDAGRAHLTVSREPDLYVDGLPCCDQQLARSLAHAGLVTAKRRGRPGERVPAVLTGNGRRACSAR